MSNYEYDVVIKISETQRLNCREKMIYTQILNMYIESFTKDIGDILHCFSPEDGTDEKTLEAVRGLVENGLMEKTYENPVRRRNDYIFHLSKRGKAYAGLIITLRWDENGELASEVIIGSENYLCK